MSSIRLLRGVYRVGREDADTAALLYSNLLRLTEALENGQYVFQQPDERRIADFARDVAREHREAPSCEALKRHCETEGGDWASLVSDKADDVASAKLLVRSDYAKLLEAEVREQKRGRAAKILETGQQIALKGVKPDKNSKKVLHGERDALDYVTRELAPLCGDGGGKTLSDVWTEGEEVLAGYEAAKSKPPGLTVGLAPIDQAFGGIRPGELWVHAAPTGQLKSSLALNWAYRATTEGTNVLYVSLEMTAEQLRRLSYVLHSASGAWQRPGLDYAAVRDGRLTHADEQHLRVVAEHAASVPGKLHVWSPSGATSMQQVFSQAESLHAQNPVGLIVVDHSGLVQPSSRDRDFYVRINSVFVDAKRGALGFAGGRGVPLLVLHQMNREGSRSKAKNGDFATFHLSNANEVE